MHAPNGFLSFLRARSEVAMGGAHERRLVHAVQRVEQVESRDAEVGDCEPVGVQ